jgi:acetyl-CoA/propionyl-CoA carboxylase biotin carboxyl carrier protein
VVLGVTTNTSFLRALLSDPDVQAGRLDTTLAERIADPPTAPAAPDGPAPDGPALDEPSWRARQAPAEVLAAAALSRLIARAGSDPWEIPDGWRIGGPAWTTFRFRTGGGDAEVKVRGLSEVLVGAGEDTSDPVPAHARVDGDTLRLSYGGRTFRFTYAAGSTGAADGTGPSGGPSGGTAGGPAGGTVTWLGRDGQAWALTEESAAPVRGGDTAAGDGTVRSPMPGTVLTVNVKAGDPVTAGQPVVVVEAMKMEHAVPAPIDGVVAELTVNAGQQVQMDQTLAVIEKPAASEKGQEKQDA